MKTQSRDHICEREWDGSYRLSVALFPTDLGWFAMWGIVETVHGMAIGHPSAVSARRSAHERIASEYDAGDLADEDWHPELRRRLERSALGKQDDFRDVRIALPPLTEFQREVLCATRRIGCGQTRSYAELAEDAGHPRAARAVGTVMANNRVPVIVPCHRVVASGGKWGGFSAPQGVDLKRRMLEVENAVLEPVES